MTTHHIRKHKRFSQIVGAKEKRILREKSKPKHSILFGLGMFGLVGWSVVVPTVLGTLLGIWLDKSIPAKHSWTLTLLIIGLIVGCVTAWHWVSGENKEIHNDKEGKNE